MTLSGVSDLVAALILVMVGVEGMLGGLAISGATPGSYESRSVLLAARVRYVAPIDSTSAVCSVAWLVGWPVGVVGSPSAPLPRSPVPVITAARGSWAQR
eukprot:CAMPEP_0119465664 /NCGR_PEP_ID=MMETSP1344-20130328/686_1 /TAXON_ID=236787 /ORGANISM="Florenciella parvula, Strain CCMP2471" /LENGTH=99 /DNA_ID=CAMNT_0007497939 /DNA_START=193 /DNA_END=492 /DNA_ORIENTATION=+